MRHIVGKIMESLSAISGAKGFLRFLGTGRKISTHRNSMACGCQHRGKFFHPILGDAC